MRSAAKGKSACTWLLIRGSGWQHNGRSGNIAQLWVERVTNKDQPVFRPHEDSRPITPDLRRILGLGTNRSGSALVVAGAPADWATICRDSSLGALLFFGHLVPAGNTKPPYLNCWIGNIEAASHQVGFVCEAIFDILLCCNRLCTTCMAICCLFG
jgi:hypothetical protein